MNPQDYITRRIMDACLREDVGGLRSRGEIQRDGTDTWLYVPHLGLRLRVAASDYLQPWVVVEPCWQQRHHQAWRKREGYAAWLALLAPGDDQQARQLYADYKEEADAACQQGELCRQAFLRQSQALSRPLAGRGWGERLRHADQVASFLDHPYYPTARAKFGFDADQLTRYAPEFAQRFLLRWLAVPKSDLTLLQPQRQPDWWPTFAQVGLPQALQASHALLPVHPLTWQQVSALPAEVLAGPKPWLAVYPTLSVRTLQLADYPDCHIKVPLAMRTLGQKNIRLIKPSTLYDGQWFAEVLSDLAEQDPLLRGRYRHVDESFCGHLGDDKLYAFLVRRYPQPRPQETLAPVAALGGRLPDGRSYLEFVLDQPGLPKPEDWWLEYCRLMAEVHLCLWLRYGIALEANQQNAIISFTPGEPLSLVMKDNDSARLWPARFASARPDLAHRLGELRDDRIRVGEEKPLAQMFITIILQLDLAALLENLAAQGVLERAWGYRMLRRALQDTVEKLERQGADTALARQALFAEPLQPVKYLLQSGSLLSKKASGAADINKYYGNSGPNFLRGAQAR